MRWSFLFRLLRFLQDCPQSGPSSLGSPAEVWIGEWLQEPGPPTSCSSSSTSSRHRYSQGAGLSFPPYLPGTKTASRNSKIWKHGGQDPQGGSQTTWILQVEPSMGTFPRVPAHEGPSRVFTLMYIPLLHSQQYYSGENKVM